MFKWLRLWWLCRRLSSDDKVTRKNAAVALGDLRDPRAVDSLTKALDNSYEHDVCAAVAGALVKLGEPTIEPLIEVMRARKLLAGRYAAEALGQLGDLRAVEPLIDELGRGSLSEGAAAEALGRLGDLRGVRPLIKALGTWNGDHRKLAAQALARLGELKWESLIRGDHRDFGCLAKSGDPRAFEPLINALSKRRVTQNGFVILALGDLGDLRAVEPLIKELQNSDHLDRWAAIRALATLGDPRAIDPLTTALADRDGRVRKDAAQALARFGMLQWEPIIRGDEGDFERFAVSGDPRAVDALINTMECPYSSVRHVAAQALGKSGDRRAVEPLIKALGEGDMDIRRAAAQALVRLGEVKWEPLIRGDDGDIERLAASGDPRAIEALIKAMDYPHISVRKAAAQALGKFGDPRAVERLIAALEAGEQSVRRTVAEVLTGLLTATSAVSPAISLSRWQRVHGLIMAPHQDGRSDCGYHHDKGIGLDFPAKPPAGPVRKTDF